MADVTPEQLQDLADSFYDLTGAVKLYADETKKAASAMASGAKSSRDSNARVRKAFHKAVSVQEQNNLQQQTNLKNEETFEQKQQKLFEDELRYRGYKVDAYGNEVRTKVDLTIAQQKELFELDKRIKQEKEAAQAATDPAQAFRDISRSVKSSDDIINLLTDRLFEFAQNSKGFTVAIIAGTAIAGGIVKGIGSMAESIYRGERGASVGAKAAKEFADSVSKAAYAIGAAFMFIPGLSLAYRVAGAAIAALGFATEKSTKLIEMGAEYNDKVYNAFQQLAEVGGTTAQGMTGVSNTFEKLSISTHEIEKFNSFIVSNSKDLALFGGTTSGGLEKFAKVAETIVKPGSELNTKLLLLGYSTEKQREHTLKYMAMQTRMGMLQNKQTSDQIKGSVGYMEELDRIATLTGISRKEQEDNYNAVLQIEALRAALFEAERTGDKDRQRELEESIKYSKRLLDAGRKKEAAAFAEYAAADFQAVSPETAAAMQSSRGAAEAIKAGKTGEDVYEEGLQSLESEIQRVAPARAIGADISATILDFNASLDDLKSRNKFLDDMKKAGFTSREEYAKYLQKLKTDKPDPSLAKNVEAIQIQQKAALNLTEAAKLMDGAGLSMALSVKAFNEAVELLAKAKGVNIEKSASGLGMTPEEQTQSTSIDDLTDQQREVYNKALNEYKKAIEGGTILQKHFHQNLDRKMLAARRRLELAQQGRLPEQNPQPPPAAPPAAPSTGQAPTLPTMSASDFQKLDKDTTTVPNTAAEPATLKSSQVDEAPIDVQKAMIGGIFDDSGLSSVMPYKSTMTASEILSSIKNSTGKVARKTVESELPGLEKISTTSSMSMKQSQKSKSFEILDKFTNLMEQKFDDVIGAISENNNIKEELLLYSRV